MSQTRRQFIATSAAAGAALALGACGGDDEESAAGGDGGAQTGTLTFTTWASDAELAAYTAVIRTFERANRGAKVKLRQVPFEESRQSIDADLEAGRAPDLFRVTYQDFGFYASNNALLDMSPLLPSGYGEAFQPGFWQAVQFEGKPYGVPHHTDVSALVYNKAVFRRAGITSVPDRLEDAYTWDEFLDVMRRVRDRAKVDPFGMNWQSAGAYRWLNWLYAAGGQMVTPDLKTATLEGSAEGKKTLEYFQTWFEEDLTPKNMTPKGAYPSEVFPSGKIAMISTGDFLLPTFADTVKRFEFGATFLPRDTSAATDLGGTAVVVTGESKLPELAAKFAQALADEANMKAFTEATTTLPTRTALVEGNLDFKVTPELMPVFQQQATTLAPELVKATTLPDFTRINTSFQNEIEALTVRGQSADETLRNMQASVTDVLAS